MDMPRTWRAAFLVVGECPESCGIMHDGHQHPWCRGVPRIVRGIMTGIGGGIVAAWRGESDWAVEWMLVCPSRGIWRCYRAMSWLDDANKPAAGVVPEPEHGLAATLRAVASALSHRMACRRRESPSQRRRQASSWSCNRDEPVTVGERPSHGVLTTAIIASASPAGQLMAGRLRLDSARTPPRL